MKAHEQRVVDEKKELDAKHEKLGAFINTDKYFALEEQDRDLLVEQFETMRAYSNVLQRRIDRFEEPAAAEK